MLDFFLLPTVFRLGLVESHEKEEKGDGQLPQHGEPLLVYTVMGSKSFARYWTTRVQERLNTWSRLGLGVSGSWRIVSVPRPRPGKASMQG